MKAYIYTLIVLLMISCNSSKEKKDFIDNKINGNIDTISRESPKVDSLLIIKKSLSNEKQNLIISFFELFESKQVSIEKFRQVFGSHIEEEELFFFESCESENSTDYCNNLFDNCLNNISQCESSTLKKIKKNNIVKESLLIFNKDSIIKRLNKIDNYKYEAMIGKEKYVFLFTGNEQGKWIVRDFSINSRLVFKSLFD